MVVTATAAYHCPFKDKKYLFYVRTQCVPHRKHSPARLYKTNWSSLDKTKAAVWSEIHTEHIDAK